MGVLSAAGTIATSGGVEVRLEGVIHIYRSAGGEEVVVLRGVDLVVAESELVALLGPSGAGKSTLLALLAGDLVPSAGRVLIGHQNLSKLSGEAMARLRAFDVSLVAQDAGSNLLPYATALENVWFSQQGARRRGRELGRAPLELLELFNLGDLADLPAEKLSSGQRQQVALVAGVAVLPRTMLIDEPTSQLGDAARDEVIATISSIHDTLGSTVVIVTHDPAVAASTERTVTVREGRVGAEGRGVDQFGVVGHDGSVQLPVDVVELFPPGGLVRFERGRNFVALYPADQHD